MDDEEEQESRDYSIVASHVAQLAEHFDTVQVFCTRTAEGVTFHMNHGSGNWFARYGHVKLWVMSDENRHIREDAECEEGD